MLESDIRVEIVIHKTTENEEVLEGYNEFLKDLIINDSDAKMMLSVPLEWVGFRNGMANELMRVFGRDIFFALAYFAHGENKTVYDFEGNRLDGFSATQGNIPGKKYVKKRLMVLERINQETNYITIKAYVFNIKYTVPVLKVLELACFGEDGFELAVTLGRWLNEVKVARETCPGNTSV